jgi:predicted amidophosphoribosyltransferase
VTSGTTLSAAATALRAAGAIVVDAFTLANAQPGLHYCLRLERG